MRTSTSRLACLAVIVLALLFAAAPLPAAAQDESPTPEETQTPTETPGLLGITSPQAGAIVQGVVQIAGTSALQDFTSYEIAFAFSDNPTGTWFVLQTGEQPVSEGTLGVWDTNGITDGRYDLRLRVFLADGTFRVTAVSGVMVSNYTPTQTAVPSATFPATWTPAPIIPTATSTAAPTPLPTATALPPNPAALTVRDVMVFLLYGALAIALLFGLYGVISWVRDSRE